MKVSILVATLMNAIALAVAIPGHMLKGVLMLSRGWVRTDGKDDVNFASLEW